MSYKKQELLTFHEQLGSPWSFRGIYYFCGPIMCLYVLLSVLCCPYDFRMDARGDVRFVFAPSCLWEASYFIYVVCAGYLWLSYGCAHVLTVYMSNMVDVL